MQKRLFVVSNRLPITVTQENGGYTCRQSSGGLISSINAYLKGNGNHTFTSAVWAGVPDCNEKMWNAAISECPNGDYNYLPVFIHWKKYELYYSGFSNSVLWPLFHYFPSFAEFNLTYFKAYMEANEKFADILLTKIRKDDVIWIHDYHLLPLAGILRKRFPNITIGFFLHIPFPSYELFRIIPKQWQREILTGMLGADLIGFHTVDYSSHFLSCIEKILKAEHDGQFVSWDNRQVKADNFPISIDFELFHHSYDNTGISELRKSHCALKGDKQLLFSVDRLDYTKGISNRLKGYEQFLLDNPEYLGKVVFALVLVPSRDSITKYAERKKLIDEFIGNLNSRLGNFAWQPVIYQYAHLSFDELIAFYTACDLALITPLRDGMNLVAKEFVASRKDKQGVLILSEMAGAAKELTEALLINPNDTSEIARMIKKALEMSANEQQERISSMQRRLALYDVNIWAADFFEELNNVKEMQLEFEIKFLDTVTKVNLYNQYADADRRLVLLDYDGTLVPFSKLPMMAAPDEYILQILAGISNNPKNEVYIVSGRDSQTLEKWFGNLQLGLIAEHGAKIRNEMGAWEVQLQTQADFWKPEVARMMYHAISKCPQSFVEEKEFSLAWHYRNSDLIEGNIRAKELFNELNEITAPQPLNVLFGNKVIEVRPKGINKGTAIDRVLANNNYNFILAIGDDKTDEDMFKRLAKVPEAFTIKVGNEASFAKYNLHNPAMVQNLLATISEYSNHLVAN